jgi:hypothetical protein
MTTDALGRTRASTDQELAVRNLIATYAHALDDRRLDDCARCFRPDAVLVFDKTTYVGRPAIREWMDTLPVASPGCHLTTNTAVWVEDGSLRADSDFGLLKHPDGPWIILASGRYIDSVVDDGEGIGFAHRVIDFS